MEKLKIRKQKKCRAYISKDAQIESLKQRIIKLEQELEEAEEYIQNNTLQ